MAIVLKSGSRVRDPCLRPGHAIVWQNTFLSQYLSPPRSINGTCKFSGKPKQMLGDNFAMDWYPN